MEEEINPTEGDVKTAEEVKTAIVEDDVTEELTNTETEEDTEDTTEDDKE